MSDDLVYRLRKRAEIRRQIPDRKSVQEGQPDRIADLLEEASDALSKHEWVGLTKDEVDSWELPEKPTVFEFVQFVEVKLKENT